MGNGMSDYWRAKRAYEREELIMVKFLTFMQKLLGSRGHQVQRHL